jgi:alkylated DNA repair dioxygenase AlkB
LKCNLSMSDQTELFGRAPVFPEGFKYQDRVVPRESEATLLEQVRHLPFEAFQFHGHEGKRRVVSFGWRYDFNHSRLDATDDIPAFLLELRVLAGDFARIAPAKLQQVLITEYDVGAGIGWHKDKSVFGEVVGISLLSPCVFRLRRRAGAKWERVSLTAEPGSAYLLSGAARTEWEHSIPPVDALRYSITYRNLRA